MLRTFTHAAAVALALSTVTVLALALHSGEPPAHSTPLFQGAGIDASTLALFQRACQNCHSENTRWPWYFHIPPASWMIARDVHEARRHVNFSQWESYPVEERENLLARIGAEVRTGQMPLPRYVFFHREAVLTEQERQQIYEWAKAKRKRLRVTGVKKLPFAVSLLSAPTSPVKLQPNGP